MGVKGLWKLINKATITWNTLNRGIDADQRDSMVVAVDGPNLVHEMLHVHGADVMAWGSVEPVVDSIMTLRIRPLLRAGASLIVIFDGECPAAKLSSVGRSQARLEPQKQLSELSAVLAHTRQRLDGDKDVLADEEFHRLVELRDRTRQEMDKLRKKMIGPSPQLMAAIYMALEAENSVLKNTCPNRFVRWEMAPYEADPVLANLFLTGTAHAVLSRDSDLFTYGLTWLVDKIQLKADQLSFSIKYLKPLPQFSLAYERLDKLEPNFDYLSLSFPQRCALAAVLGTDYSGSGLTGMSLVKFSLGLAKAGGDFENFLGNLYRTALSPAWHLIRCSVISQLYHPIGVTDGSLVYLPGFEPPAKLSNFLFSAAVAQSFPAETEFVHRS
jgi:hypothetical protein